MVTYTCDEVAQYMRGLIADLRSANKARPVRFVLGVGDLSILLVDDAHRAAWVVFSAYLAGTGDKRWAIVNCNLDGKCPTVSYDELQHFESSNTNVQEGTP